MHLGISRTCAIAFAALALAAAGQAQTACNVSYTISSQWPGGFGAALTIDNTGTTAISNWTLGWSFANGQTVTELWNGNVTQSGANVTVTNMSYNGSIAAGGSLTGVGFNGTWNNATNSIPTAFTLNGVACGTPGVGTFTLSASASTAAVTQGGASATDTISVVDAGGFTGAVTLATSGLPTGVTATFGTNPATATSVVTFTAASTATVGTSTVTITGTSGTLTASAKITLTVNSSTPPGFTLTPSSPSLTVAQCQTVDSTIGITDVGGFTGTVTLAVTGLPAGMTLTIGTNPAASSSVLAFTAGCTTPVGTYPLTITGVSSTGTETTIITITVTPALNFTIAASATSVSVAQGSSATDTIVITDIGSFTGAVTLSASGLPTGVTATFGTNPTTGTSIVTFTASSSAIAGGSVATITGVSGTTSESTTILVTVTGPPSFTLTPSSPTLSVVAGSTVTLTLTITDLNGFTGNVTCSIPGSLPIGVTASFGTPNNSTCTITFTVSSSATPGTSALTITGASGTITASATVQLIITAAPSFTLAASPATLSVTPGASGTGTIVVTDVGGFTGAVTLTATGLPTGVTATFGTNAATSSSVVTLAASCAATTGSAAITITGTSGTLTALTTIALTVPAVVAPPFTISPSAATLSLTQGGTATDTLTSTDSSCFTGSVTYAASGLPTGVTAAFSPNPATASSTLTLTATSSATTGPSTVTVTGTSGSTSVSTPIALTVAPSTPAGSSCNVTYTISPQSSSSFGATIAITNTGTTAWTSWTLQWIFPNGQTIQSLWNGIETQSGALVTVTNESYNGSVAAGGSVSNIGFNGNIVGGNSAPTAFSVNGSLCGPLSGEPPLAPTGLAATSGNQQIALSWTPSLTASSYIVDRSTTSGGPYTNVGSATTTSFTNTGLTNGTVYYYVVEAVNTAGDSGNSNQVFATPATVAANVTIVVNPAQTQPISPWIYGINGNNNSVIPNIPDVTVLRMGGNRWTAYNWTTNASNAGSDFNYESDDFLSSSTIPGFAVYPNVNDNIAAGEATLFTIPIQGLVSADESGDVPTANAPDLARFQDVVYQKSSVTTAPFTTTPPIVVVNGEDTGDVYDDEFVWAINQLSTTQELYNGTTPTPAFVDLDNEPDLWNSTHLEVQGPTNITPAAYIAKTLSVTQALKTQFPKVVIFGPVNYGFLGIYNWQSAITTTTPTGENWFIDEYLQALSTASATFGEPLVNVYDFHWYPEDYDASSTRVTSLTASTLADADMQLIVQADRNLWDPTFTDPGNSNPWINSVLGNTPVDILGRLQAKAAAEFPSIQFSISEYETGGFNNIAGTVAQADELGVFAQQGLFAAMFWPPSGTYDYELAGFRAFRDFDGNGSNFGNVLVQTTSSNPGSVTAYVSTDTTTPGRIVIVAINRANTSQVAAISGIPLSGSANLYQITATTAATQSPSAPVTPVSIGSQAVSGTSLTLTLPAYSVTTINIP